MASGPESVAHPQRCAMSPGIRAAQLQHGSRFHYRVIAVSTPNPALRAIARDSLTSGAPSGGTTRITTLRSSESSPIGRAAHDRSRGKLTDACVAMHSSEMPRFTTQKQAPGSGFRCPGVRRRRGRDGGVQDACDTYVTARRARPRSHWSFVGKPPIRVDGRGSRKRSCRDRTVGAPVGAESRDTFLRGCRTNMTHQNSVVIRTSARPRQRLGSSPTLLDRIAAPHNRVEPLGPVDDGLIQRGG